MKTTLKNLSIPDSAPVEFPNVEEAVVAVSKIEEENEVELTVEVDETNVLTFVGSTPKKPR